MTIHCAEFLAEYSEFRDGLLSPARERAVASHLAACPACARRDRQFRRGAQLLRSSAELQPSADFMARLECRLAADRASRPGWARWQNWKGLLSVPGALTVGIAIGVLSRDWIDRDPAVARVKDVPAVEQVAVATPEPLLETPPEAQPLPASPPPAGLGLFGAPGFQRWPTVSGPPRPQSVTFPVYHVPARASDSAPASPR